MGQFMEELSPQVVLGLIMALLQVVYMLPMRRLRLIVMTILLVILDPQ